MNKAMWMAGASAALVCVSAASAAPMKVKDFAPISAGIEETPHADAMASLKYNDAAGSAKFHLVAHDLLPNQTYGVYVETEFGWAFSHAEAFTTNSRGHGHWHADIDGFFEGNYTVILYIWDPTIGFPGVPPEERSWLDLTPEEWRMIGTTFEE